jgi:hypothetical protein
VWLPGRNSREAHRRKSALLENDRVELPFGHAQVISSIEKSLDLKYVKVRSSASQVLGMAKVSTVMRLDASRTDIDHTCSRDVGEKETTTERLESGDVVIENS